MIPTTQEIEEEMPVAGEITEALSSTEGITLTRHDHERVRKEARAIADDLGCTLAPTTREKLTEEIAGLVTRTAEGALAHAAAVTFDERKIAVIIAERVHAVREETRREAQR